MKGRPTSARYAGFADFQIHAGRNHIYVVERSDGVVKVGTSSCVRNRLKSLVCEFNREGLGIGRVAVSIGGRQREREVIRAMCAIGRQLPGRIEYFSGLRFEDAVNCLPFIAPATPEDKVV